LKITFIKMYMYNFLINIFSGILINIFYKKREYKVVLW
jgi:hypothetical protein